MPRRPARLRSLAAVALLAAITVGIPVLLIAIAGWPLPRQLPDWDRVRIAIQQGDIPAEVVINTLAVIVWIAWAQLVWALGWELAVNLPRAQNGEPARPAPLVPAAVAGGIGRLVAVLFAVGLTVATTPTPTLARPAVPAALVETPAAPAAAPRHQTEPTRRVGVLAGRRTGQPVGHRRTSPRRRRTSPRDPRAQPRHEIARATCKPASCCAFPTAPRSPPATRPRRPQHPIRPAGSRSTRRPATWPRPSSPSRPATPCGTSPKTGCSTANGQPARPAATVAYLDEVIAANPDTIEDPNLIYAGEQFRFPAIGTPPPPPPAPPQPAEPPPARRRRTAPTRRRDARADVDPAAAPAADLAGADRRGPAGHDVTGVAVGRVGPGDGRAGSPSDHSPRTAEDESPAPWIAGLAGATVLASGLVLVYRRARNRAAAAGASNLRAVSTDARGRQIERALTTASNLPLVRWANHELAALATRLDPRRVTSATPVAVEISETRGIELLWTSPMPSAPAPWEATDGGWAWRILYDPDLPVPASPEPAVLPGLVTIGQREGKSVLVDLEALGSLAITGDPTAAENLARSILVELAAGDDLANSYVHAVGIDLDSLPRLDRAQARDETSALELLQSIRGDHDALLERHRLSTTFQLRLGGTTGRELTVVAARAGAVDDVDRLIEAAPPHRGVALVIVGAAATARATLDVDANGQASLRPLGLHLTANQLPAAASRRDRRAAPRGGRTPTAQRSAGGTRPHIASAEASRLDIQLDPARPGRRRRPRRRRPSPWATSRTLRSSSESSAFPASTASVARSHRPQPHHLPRLLRRHRHREPSHRRRLERPGHRTHHALEPHLQSARRTRRLHPPRDQGPTSCTSPQA